MTNIVQKGQQRWMRNTFTKKRAANTSYTSLQLPVAEYDGSICFISSLLPEKLLSLFVLLRCGFLRALLLLCVCFYLCCNCHRDPLPPPRLCLHSHSRPFDVSSVAGCGSQPTEAEQCGDEDPERHQDGKHQAAVVGCVWVWRSGARLHLVL